MSVKSITILNENEKNEKNNEKTVIFIGHQFNSEYFPIFVQYVTTASIRGYDQFHFKNFSTAINHG